MTPSSGADKKILDPRKDISEGFFVLGARKS